MRVSGLSIYPVKSMRALAVTSMSFDRMGPAGDRRWMVVGPEGKMVTQRQQPLMALLGAVPDDAGLVLSCGADRLRVAVDPAAPLRLVEVWGDQVAAHDAGDVAAEWLSGFLRSDVRLVVIAPDAARHVDRDYAQDEVFTAFSDGFPVLLAAEESLQSLNLHLPGPIGMERFRPNIVVAGATPWAEDGWRRIKIGEMVFRVVKPCSRCVIPSINPLNGEKQAEVIQVLKEQRGRDGKTWFGQNMLIEHWESGQVIRVGDSVTVLE